LVLSKAEKFLILWLQTKFGKVKPFSSSVQFDAGEDFMTTSQGFVKTTAGELEREYSARTEQIDLVLTQRRSDLKEIEESLLKAEAGQREDFEKKKSELEESILSWQERKDKEQRSFEIKKQELEHRVGLAKNELARQLRSKK